MTLSKYYCNSWLLSVCQVRLTLMLVAGALTALPMQTSSQSLSHSGDPLVDAGGTASGTLDLTYLRPPPRTTLKNYAFDAFGPYPFLSTALIAAVDQETRTPPEWNEGFGGYAQRYGSDFGIAVIGTTTRYGLAAILKEDTSYYPCECRGLSPRLRHAVVSTLTARRGEDGHRIFSIPALVSPYAGAAGGVYGWYPNRYSVGDVFRMGNYSLLESVGADIALEFLYSGPHSLLSRMHLNSAHRTPGPGRPSQ